MRKVSITTKLTTILAATAFAMVTMVACGGDDDNDDTTANGATTGGNNASNNGTTGNGSQTGNNSTSTGGGTAGTTATTANTCDKTPITCGGAECAAPATSTAGTATGLAGMATQFTCLKPCCTVENKCGASMSLSLGGLGGIFGAMMGGGTGTQSTPTCVEQNQGGAENAACPGLMDQVNQATRGEDGGTTRGQQGMQGMGQMGINAKGCCRTADNTCGYLMADFGVGCITGKDIQSVFSGMLGGMAAIGGGNNTATDTTPKACTP
jgi:hypothetical protein